MTTRMQAVRILAAANKCFVEVIAWIDDLTAMSSFALISAMDFRSDVH